jgi:hypothetical protein
MSITAFSGPVISYGQNAIGNTTDYNPDLAPSLFWGGAGVIDPRPNFNYVPGQNFGSATAGFLGTTSITTYDYNPTVASATAISAAAAAVANTAVTLVSSNSATTGVAVSQAITRSDTGVAVTGLLALDACTQVSGYISNGTSGTAGNILIVSTASAALLSAGMIISGTGVTAGTQILGPGPSLNVTNGAPGAGFAGTYYVSGADQAAGTSGSPITITATISNSTNDGVANSRFGFGQSDTVQLWNPQALSARNVVVTPATAGSAVNWTVRGYDIYGYPMTEVIATAADSNAVAGKKAFKYIASVTPDASSTGTHSVGTGTVFGFALRSDTFGDVLINYATSTQNPALITANTGYLASVKTYATTTTGDVRGTYSATAAVANRFVFRQSPQLYNAGSITGLFGVTQA